MALDSRATKILLKAYWTSAGWRRRPEYTPEEFAYAKANGVMFDDAALSHDEAVIRAISAREAVSQAQVVSAFVASLSTRRLDLRSALGSYAVARHLAAHKGVYSHRGSACEICGARDKSIADFNVLNFERIKWGGVRHHDVIYIGFDLSRLRETPPLLPTRGDREMMLRILEICEAQPADAKLRNLVQALGHVFASNTDERRVLISILGFCGILIDDTLPDFRDHFVPPGQRPFPPHGKNDWPYPVQWWTGVCGVQRDAISDWFPQVEHN